MSHFLLTNENFDLRYRLFISSSSNRSCDSLELLVSVNNVCPVSPVDRVSVLDEDVGSVWSLFSFFSFYLQSSTLLNKFWFSFFGISQSTHSSSKCILDASICLVSFLSFPPSFRQFFRNKCLSKLYRFKLDNRFRHG